MNRCFTTLLAALAIAGGVHAQESVRKFPKQTLRGELVVKLPPYVEMDERVVRLSPGARIIDTSDRILRSATLVNQTLTVNYLLDKRGQISQVWLLTEAEMKEKRPGYGVERNYTFESQQSSDGQPAASTTAN
ncbi:MAG: hypothetical protein KF871_12410 [Hydrogenophaga sp.]|uniref:hypothetical protein n=1 Tax=Hydrogenophaga sp. TaxID=1904254 RepID=UPI001DD058A6|nr:hypothetical protein [Hydrogenophaga sp.]MBX3610689.1 hypothetical protein [Hydrogenophaga sp.]